MDFKIDTKDAFTTIMPLETQISAKMTGELHLQLTQMRQSGSKNFIIDLGACTEMDEAVITDLVDMHEESYGIGQSLVFTGVNDKIMKTLKKSESDLLINIAMKMIEAVDIVCMEVLERDLMSEE